MLGLVSYSHEGSLELAFSSIACAFQSVVPSVRVANFIARILFYSCIQDFVMSEGSVTLSIVFSVNIVVWPLPMLAPTPVVGVVSILNPSASFLVEHEGCTVHCGGLSPSWLRISSLPCNKLFYNICNFKLQL